MKITNFKYPQLWLKSNNLSNTLTTLIKGSRRKILAHKLDISTFKTQFDVKCSLQQKMYTE